MWILFAIISAFFLGFYDISKKVSLNNNAVIPVLFVSTLVSCVIFIGFIGYSLFFDVDTSSWYYIPYSGLRVQIHIFIKTLLVVGSWLFSFFALKHLPITIVSPVRSTGPVWTLVGAIILFGERLSLYQWLGLGITLIFFYLFSTAGKREGIIFQKNKYILFIVFATILGATSGLYDKLLIASCEINKLEVQAWFSIYQVIILLPVLLVLWYPKRKNNTPFEFRWSILLIGLLLLIADFFYFHALSIDGAMISLISTARRSNVIISFIVGGIIFKEKYMMKKFILLLGILAGIITIYMATSNS